VKIATELVKIATDLVAVISVSLFSPRLKKKL